MNERSYGGIESRAAQSVAMAQAGVARGGKRPVFGFECRGWRLRLMSDKRSIGVIRQTAVVLKHGASPEVIVIRVDGVEVLRLSTPEADDLFLGLECVVGR